MSASYVSRPSRVETRPRAPTIPSSFRRNRWLSCTAASLAMRVDGRRGLAIASASFRPRLPRGRSRRGASPLLSDGPGLARDEQLGDVSRAALGDGLLLLMHEDLLVGRLFLAGEDPDGDRI